jgi:hypothetical protein
VFERCNHDNSFRSLTIRNYIYRSMIFNVSKQLYTLSLIFRPQTSTIFSSSITQIFRSTWRGCLIAVQPALSGESSHNRPASDRGQCHFISSEFQTFYRREMITIHYGVSCWVSSFRQVLLLPVSRFKELFFIRKLKTLEIFVVDFRMPSNNSAVPLLSGCGAKCSD